MSLPAAYQSAVEAGGVPSYVRREMAFFDRSTRERLIAAVEAAGRIVLDHRARGVVAERKADRSVVTAADREAEAVILAMLADVAPDLAVVAEEACAAGVVPAVSDRFALVDALDGTREFVRGGDDFTVNLGVVDGGAPVFGIVHAPATGQTWWGDVASGEAWALGEAARRLGCVGAAAPLRAVASRSHCTPETETYLGACGAGERLSIGSSLKFLLVAEGKADLYPRAGPTMEWDTAAGDAILRAAGGMTFDLDGRPLRYGKPHFFNPGFVATGGAPVPALGPFYPQAPTQPGVRA